MATHRRGARRSQWPVRDLLGEQRSTPSALRDPRLYAAVGGLLACGAAATVAFTASDGVGRGGPDPGGPLALPAPGALVPAPPAAPPSVPPAAPSSAPDDPGPSGTGPDPGAAPDPGPGPVVPPQPRDAPSDGRSHSPPAGSSSGSSSGGPSSGTPGDAQPSTGLGRHRAVSPDDIADRMAAELRARARSSATAHEVRPHHGSGGSAAHGSAAHGSARGRHAAHHRHHRHEQHDRHHRHDQHDRPRDHRPADRHGHDRGHDRAHDHGAHHLHGTHHHDAHHRTAHHRSAHRDCEPTARHGRHSAGDREVAATSTRSGRPAMTDLGTSARRHRDRTPAVHPIDHAAVLAALDDLEHAGAPRR